MSMLLWFKDKLTDSLLAYANALTYGINVESMSNQANLSYSNNLITYVYVCKMHMQYDSRNIDSELT